MLNVIVPIPYFMWCRMALVRIHAWTSWRLGCLLSYRTSKNDEQYGYNVRDELIFVDDVFYNYDDIGNRTAAEGKTYTANALNQYTAIDDFTPQYDADGNQTRIKTETGIWSVQYNAENRPIRWESGDTIITMSFDRMGRRVEMRTVKDDEETLQRFVYDNYLCIQQLRTPSNTLYQSYVWDPTEPIATRPLIFIPSEGEVAYYFHDGNKNVVDLVDIQGGVIHYDYTPFGTPLESTFSENPYNFSSEMYDIKIGYSYYNYRHYDAWNGRFLQRDLIEEIGGENIFAFLKNDVINLFDWNGLNTIKNPAGYPPRGLPSDITCEELYAFIMELSQNIMNRRDDLLEDNFRLYNNPNAIARSKGGKGTWAGHQNAMRETQGRLETAIKYFSDHCGDFNQCLPQSVYDTVFLPIPTKPNWAQNRYAPPQKRSNAVEVFAIVSVTTATFIVLVSSSFTAPVWAPAVLLIGLFTVL